MSYNPNKAPNDRPISNQQFWSPEGKTKSNRTKDWSNLTNKERISPPNLGVSMRAQHVKAVYKRLLKNN